MDLTEELKMLDDLDIVILLTLGDQKFLHYKLQMVAFLVAEMLQVRHDFEFINGKPFSENVYDKIYTGYLNDYVVRNNGWIFLNDHGKMMYGLIRKVMMDKGMGNVLKAIDVIRSKPKREVLSLIHFLYPDKATGNSVLEELKIKRIEAVGGMFQIEHGVYVKLDNDKLVIYVDEG